MLEPLTPVKHALAAESVQKTLVWIGSVVLTVAVGACAFLAVRERALHSRSAIRQQYRDYPARVLGVKEPIKFNEVVTFEDGGTKSVTLTDATGTRFQACLDGRNWDGPYVMYVGAAYPTDEGARKVLMQGPEEAAFFGLLIRWCETDPQRSAVYEMTTEQFVEWAHRDGKKSDRKDWYIWNACGLLKLFERRFGGVY